MEGRRVSDPQRGKGDAEHPGKALGGDYPRGDEQSDESSGRMGECGKLECRSLKRGTCRTDRVGSCFATSVGKDDSPNM